MKKKQERLSPKNREKSTKQKTSNWKEKKNKGRIMP
jgi:hypothetical protein